MEARSTNVLGFVHYGGDVVAGVNDGIAIHLKSASTGGTPWIEPLSDSSTAALGVRAKGTANLTLGNSSNTMSLTASNLVLKGAYSTTFAWTLAAVSSGQTLEVTISTAVGDINPAEGDIFSLSMGDVSAYVGFAVLGYRFSTVGASRITALIGNISSTATSTASGTARINWLDLT